MPPRINCWNFLHRNNFQLKMTWHLDAVFMKRAAGELDPINNINQRAILLRFITSDRKLAIWNCHILI